MHACTHPCDALSLACLRDAASVEATALRRLAHARGRELRTVCRLAQAVLRQRSDMETFLVAALQQARAVMRWKRHAMQCASCHFSEPQMGMPC